MRRAKQRKYKLLQDQQNRVLQENTQTPTGICYKRKVVTFKVETFSFQSESLTLQRGVTSAARVAKSPPVVE
jgi:hypothetical protein